MKRIIVSAAVLAGVFGVASISDAQVFIRAPFVRVAVGDGVAVRAPFVRVFVPPSDPGYSPFGPFGPPPVMVQPMPPANGVVPQPLPPGNTLPPPQPLPPINNDPPAPAQPAQVPTLESFAKSFQPKAGSYEVTLLNPVTKQPTTVRFSLPEGTPRRVHTSRDSIEFVYGVRQFVRIEFDRDGALVTSR